ncbi:MAG: amino acid adenylation domain-containing protein [Longimicrobiaceae bacterium]
MKRAAGAVDGETIPRRAQEGPPPLSFAQQRLWVAHRLEPGSTAYNMPSPLRLRGALDGVALRRSVDELVRRHETLRTTFEERDGGPVQVVHPPAPGTLRMVDLSGLPDEAREPEALLLAEAEALRPFDLARGPLLRSTLLRLAGDDHVLCFTLHHIATDAWSMEVLVREVSALHDAFRRGEPSPLPELPVQYADFAVWQRERLAGEPLEEQLAYWRERLAGAPPLLEIPTDRPRAVGQDARTGLHPVALSAEASRALEALSRREGTTLFMAVLAAWLAVLGRWAGQEDVVVGSANAGRTRQETEGMIGFFVNMLVLRGDLSGDPTWRELLARVRETVLGAHAHQELPFERIVDELGVERSPTHTPLFQAIFNLGRSTGPAGRLELDGMRLEPFGREAVAGKFDLNMLVSETPSGLSGVLVYREALFEADTMARMAGHLEVAVEAMLGAPERRLSELSLLRGAERAQVLEDWNATEAPLMDGARVHELFAAQAARTPDALALASEDGTLTYAELDRAANRLAHRLLGLGVAPEARVGVLLEPSGGFVVALLAVLKAGGAYLPLDPSTPPERLASVLEDAGAAAVVARDGSHPALRRTRAAMVRPDAEELSREPADAPSVTVRPENAAYLIYTSGSTGQPKGVVVEHRQLANYVRAAALRLGLVPGMSHALVSTVAADLGNTVLYPSLCTGGALHVVPREVATSGERFADYVRGQGIDVLKIVPSHLAALLGAGGAGVLPRRLLVLGGEASRSAWVDELHAQAPGLVVVNHYGPTETTVGVLTHTVAEGGRGATVPLGRPLANTRVYVLDRPGQPVPLGAPGELYAGGAQVARGYAGRPEQTAERFVPDPFGPEPGGRLYRTGDRVRWLASGELEFLGRVDAQVKVRGFRVEPGEIEAVLAEHAAVRDAVVVLREDVEGQPRLAAYVVLQGGVDLGAAGLQEHLGERLPEYMVPAAYVALESIPLTPNGKLDRRALPAPDETGRYVAPRSAVEEVLAGIWSEVLGTERVGVDASFFELGGDSLLGVRMVSRVRKALGVKLQMKVLFEANTVAALATLVEGLRGGAAAAPPIEPVPRDRPLPLSFAQQRLWLVDRMEPGSPAYNIPYALRLRGAPDVGVLRWSLKALVERHEPLRTVFAEHASEPVQVIRAHAPPAFEVLDLSGLPDPEGEARRLAREEALRPFDLARGPLLRTTLLRLGADDHVLLFTVHHIVSDGWSRDLLVRDLTALYDARGRGRDAGLPHLPVQYADFAAWQRARLGGGGLEEQVAWWKGTLAGAPPLLEIPTDHPRAAGQSARSGSHGFALPRGLADGLRALARREGATLFMTVLAGWQALLGRWAGQDDVVVGTPVAGRTRTELEGLVGFFVNMLPLRLELNGNPTFAALVGRVRERALAAYDRQEVQFERLVDELVTGRSLAHSPVFQVTFSLDRDAGAAGRRLSFGDVRVEPFGGGELVSKYDLKLATLDFEAGLAGSLVYRTALFDAATAARMVGQLEVLLEAMATDPARRAAEVPLLRGDERAQVLEAWNATAAEFPDDPVHERVAAQAARTPDAVAVAAAGETLTYAELERRANRLAHHLAALGAGPDTRVAFLLERGAATVATVLAILKSGAAYVALDPTSPDERLRLVLEDSAATLVVSSAALAERVAGFGGRVVRLDADAEAISARPDAAPEVPVSPRGLAYVIYTSGSTGAPKGVLLEHRGLSNYLAWFDREVLGAEGFVLPLVSRLSFDAHVRQLFPPLLRGEAVWVLAEETVSDPGALLAALSTRERVSFGGVPSLWSAMLERVRSGEFPRPEGLVAVLLGGEALPPELAERTFETFPDVALWNHYGPTEATVNTTVARVRPGGRVTIGRPVANVRVYLLDGRGSPVPVAVPGELYVGGVGVSRGYLGQPGPTAERYLPDPFSAEPGARMYRSGDRVRWREDGELEYAGRTDDQVKVRGFRIEPGEIEAVLERHPEVRSAAVVVRDDRLVAYFVAESGASPPVAAVREHLAAQLPEYMVPATLVALESMPLGATGKTDRRALPVPEAAAPAEGAAPRTATEEVLAALYSDLLGVEAPGTDGGFFELGGHSLLATRLVSRVREAFAVELPLRAVFEAPTAAGLAGRIDALRLAGAPVLPPVERVPRDGPLPVSFAQQRLWLVDRLEPGSPAYNIPYALRLRGALDVDALRRSLDALVERHETLRTTLEERGGVPVQVINAPVPIALEVVEVADEAAAARLAAEEAARPFDLAAGPLLRCTLLRLADDDHVFCFTLHHVVSDAWSSAVLVRELSALYGAFGRGEEATLPELPVQYADYAVWQRAWLAGATLEEQVRWWRERLAGAPPLLEVPTDRPRALGQSAAAETHSFSLPPELSAGLRAFAQREGATLFMTVLAGWQALLGRRSGQDDVVVGTPVAGRTRCELEGLIGFFVNMLVLRTELGGGVTWRGLLGRVREGALGAYAHQDLPFERLVEEAATQRSLTHTPLFQVTFALERAARERSGLRLGNVALEGFEGGGRAAQFDLDLTMMDAADALHGAVRYRTALFDAATIARLAGDLETLLAAMVAAPEGRVAGVQLLPAAEREQVLAAGRGEPRPLDRGALVHELVAARAAASPELPAVACGGRVLGYGELEAEAARLAARLRARGVGPEVPVALFLDRSAELAVALLGVLGAGGAFVPVDPEYPRERVEYLLSDSGARVVVTRSDLAAALPEGGPEVLCVDDAGDPAGASAPARIGSDTLAYLIYTSGSTGRPKAAMVSHRSLVCYAEAMRERMGLVPGDRVLQFASPAFDVMIEEVFPAWLSGACVIFPGGAMPGTPRELTELLEAQRVSVVELPTAFWHEWVRETAAEGSALPESLRLVLVGGERVLAERLRQWAALDRPLLHVFGLTETTVTSTTLLLEAGEDGSRWSNLPVGTPLPDAEAYVLDAEREPVAAGVPGELYLGGETVARGYWARPELTAERYVPHPFSVEPGARLYRTGDRVRWLADGGLEFLGRIDQQLKIRGYRIEPGEVEAVLCAHPSVREAAVVARPDRRGDSALVGYVSLSAGAEPGVAELRGWLRDRLPEYMVPGALVVMESIPLTPNGKVDRRALPAPELPAEAEYVAPRGVVEETLCAIWAEVLGLERVGVEDNFFRVGGHSLLAMQVASRAQEAFGVPVSLRDLFETPTVAALAGSVEVQVLLALDDSEIAESLPELAGGAELEG